MARPCKHHNHGYCFDCESERNAKKQVAAHRAEYFRVVRKYGKGSQEAIDAFFNH